MKLLLGILRALVGTLFLFSGLVKANDPLGLCYKMQEFFLALHINFLSGIALPLSILMIGFEILAGFALLLGFLMVIFGPLLLLLTGVFTFLTAYAYFTGRIQECGCFGNCIPISNALTFWKDVVLLALVLVIFSRRRQIKPLWGRTTGIFMVLGLFLAFGLQWYTLNHLPIVDCLAYGVGKNIPQEMKAPVNSYPGQYSITMTYEKNGIKKDFGPNNYPWKDTTWKFISRNLKLIRKGNDTPPIEDFSITGVSGTDSTKEVLNHSGPLFLFLVLDTRQAGTGWNRRMDSLQAWAARARIPVLGITASSWKKIAVFSSRNGLKFPFMQMDATVIKTMGRSNPCLMLLRQGTVEGKWHYHDIPGWQDLEKKYL